MQVRTLLRTVGDAEPLSRSLWGESLVILMNQHLPDDQKLPNTCTVVDVRKAFRILSTSVRNRILDATVDLELMTIEMAEPGNNNGRKFMVFTGLIIIGLLLMLTSVMDAPATNPDPSLFMKVLNEVGPYLLGFVK